MPCESRRVDLRGLLATVVDEFRSLTAEKHLTIHFVLTTVLSTSSSIRTRLCRCSGTS